MTPIDLTQYDFTFAVNSPHPLENKEVIVFMGGTYRHVRIIGVSGDREHVADVMISNQPIIPEFLLEEITDDGKRYIHASYRGDLFEIEPPKPTSAELFGLLTRMENILTETDPGAVMRSIASLITDKDDLLVRLHAVGEKLKA